MRKDNDIAIYLPDEDAKKFMLFQQHYATFQTLIDSGVLDVRSGSVVIHFDIHGSVSLIQRADTLYNSRIVKKTYPQDNPIDFKSDVI